MKNKIRIYIGRISITVLLLLFGIWSSQTVDLSTHVSSTATSPIQLQWHNAATPSASTVLGSTTVTATGTPTNYWVYYYDTVNNCYSPGAKVTVISNTCPATTVDLTALPVTPSAPSGTVLQWHTVESGFVQSGAGQTLVSAPSAVGAGTYYPVFYDITNNCYSPTGTPVIVSISSCVKNVTATCPTNTYDLTTLTATPSAPSGTVLQWHTVQSGFVQSGAGQTLVANAAAVPPGTYYPVFYDSAANCYSPIGTPVIVSSSTCVKNVTATCPTNTYDLTTLTATPSAPSGTVLQWHTVQSGFVQSGAGQTLVANAAAVPAGTYYPVFYDSAADCYSPIGTPVVVASATCITGCYKPPVLDAGTTYPTNHGITAMGRAGADTGNWPMERQSAWTVLEAKTLGFVINRIKTTAEVNALANPVEGMMVYDVEADCLKIYTTIDNGATYGWYCFSTPGCP